MIGRMPPFGPATVRVHETRRPRVCTGASISKRSRKSGCDQCYGFFIYSEGQPLIRGLGIPEAYVLHSTVVFPNFLANDTRPA